MNIKYLPESIENRLQLFTENLKNFGIDYVEYVLFKKNRATAFFSHKEWAQLYIEKSYFQDDPFTRIALNSNTKVIMWNNVPLAGKAREVINMRKKLCKINQGITFSTKYKGFHDIFAIATKNENIDISKIITNKALLHKFLLIKQKMMVEHQKAH